MSFSIINKKGKKLKFLKKIKSFFWYNLTNRTPQASVVFLQQAQREGSL